MMNFEFKKFDEKVASAKEWLAKEYRSLRTGRATPSILDGVIVAAYGSNMPLKQVATVSVEDPRTLRVQPFDVSLIKDIERGITNSDLGLGMVVDSSGLRVSFPSLTGERRAELIKMAKGKLEEARATIRVARDEAWKEIQEKEREGTLTEDDKYSLKDELQKKVDKANDDMETAFDNKEKEMAN